MRRYRPAALGALLCAISRAVVPETSFVAGGQEATTGGCTAPPEFPNLHQSYSMKITASHKHTQAHFDNGLVHVYGFNRPEALKAFNAAAACEGVCPMCLWGVALACGPNMNGGLSLCLFTSPGIPLLLPASFF